VSYEDGPDATVSVEQVDGIIAPAELGCGSMENGRRNSIGCLQSVLLGHLPLLVKPDAKDVFVLGLGRA